MRSLVLFKSSFSKVQKVLDSVQRIKDGPFKKTCKRIQLERSARCFQVANLVEAAATEIQSPFVEKQLSDFQEMLESRDLTISYDYQRKGFQMEPRTATSYSHPWMHLQSTPLEKADHPHIRETLYFHQLKDLENYFTIPYPKNTPKFARDILRKSAENRLLDSKNPLGLPIYAKPLRFMLNFKQRFLIEFYCRYGNINIRTVRLLDEAGKCKHLLSGMNIPRPIQRIVFDYCRQEVLLEEMQVKMLHRLSYIGGRVEELQDLIRLYYMLSANIDPQTRKPSSDARST